MNYTKKIEKLNAKKAIAEEKIKDYSYVINVGAYTACRNGYETAKEADRTASLYEAKRNIQELKVNHYQKQIDNLEKKMQENDGIERD